MFMFYAHYYPRTFFKLIVHLYRFTMSVLIRSNPYLNRVSEYFKKFHVDTIRIRPSNKDI